MRKESVRRLVFLLLCSVGTMPMVQAQENATINGVATDSAGALVTNAQVKLVNPETGDTRSATTNDAGLFNFTGLRIGRYNLSVTAAGFKVATLNGKSQRDRLNDYCQVRQSNPGPGGYGAV